MVNTPQIARARPFLLAMLIATLIGCQKDSPIDPCPDCTDNDLIEGATYDPRPYDLEPPFWMPRPFIPTDNPLSVDGVELGRYLFFDPILSSDSTMSCASCHDPRKAFTDGRRFSVGVLGREGKRSAMSLANLAYNLNGFFWDGGVKTLEEQALIPIEDHLELNESWDNVVRKLQRHAEYPLMFRRAFGIDRKSEISKELAVKAIAQFERTLISGNSRFDRVVWKNEGWFTDAEERGRKLFFFEPFFQEFEHPGCSHCHFDPLYTDNLFHNNGLEYVARLEDFPDPGRGGVSRNRFDYGRFRTPTLRNIELTAPYMHDGRFATLEEVLDQYSAGGHGVENENVNIIPFPLSERDKADLIAFLKTLTDTSFINDPRFHSPFE